MARYWHLIALSFTALFFVTACDRPGEPMVPKIDRNEQKNAPAADDKTSDAGKAQEEFVNKSREEIDQLRGRIDELEAKAKSAGADLKSKLEKQVQDLRAELGDVEGQWQTVKEASAAAWEKTRDTLSASLEKLRKAVHDATG